MDNSDRIYWNKPMKAEATLLVSFDRKRYEAHKSKIAILLGHFFLRHLNLLYQEFDGDLVLAIVLGEIAHRNTVRVYSRNGHCIEFQDQIEKHPERLNNLLPSNAYSIGEATGIPRETIRRKIDKLV